MSRDRWTIADAVSWLDPPIGRRELARLIRAKGLQPAGYRHFGWPGGRPAAEYEIRQIQDIHTEWVNGRFAEAG